MRTSIACVLWLLVITQGTTQAKECRRTNTKPKRWCLETTCQTDKDCGKDEKCRCDGDCGMSCIKNGLKCSTLRTPKNAIVQGKGRAFQDTVTYICKKGYTLRGPRKRTCRGIGTWDGRNTRCPMLCKNPGDIKFGSKNEDKRYHKVGSKVNYWCFPGYEREGSREITCTKSGAWSSSPPKCKLPSCTKPTSPENSQTRKKLKEKYKYNEIILYECKHGYFISGMRAKRCLNGGKWSDMNMKCIAKSCKNPGTPKNGRRKGYVFTFKKKVYYECNRGYILIGPQFRICQSNQKWSDKLPTCEPVDCGRLPIPNHGEKIEETKTTYLGRVVFRCNKKGFELKGSRTRVCQESGKWDGSLTKCERVTCTNPEIPDFGGRKPDMDKYVYEDKIEFSCKTNHTRYGSKAIICQADRTWTEDPPKCLRPCPDPGIPKGGFRLEHSFLHDKTVRFTCKKGWKLDGKEEIKCKNGDWTDIIPRCLDCDDALGMQNRNIPDKNIKASSWSQWHDARYARLRGSSAWCTGLLTRNPFLEINLGRPFKITSLATQGSRRDKIWERKYIVSHSLAKSSFIEYREGSKEKVFDGNVDATTVVKHKLKQPFIAKRIRFYPTGWRILGLKITRSCMRVEIYGCDLPKDCVMVGSPVLGEWMNVPNGGSAYYKSFVKTIDHVYNEVQLELDDERIHNDKFKTLRKSSIVMDTPNKHFNLDIGTRVLVPDNGRFYTGKIKRKDRNYYGVTLDDKTFKWPFKKEIRVLGKTKFCDRG